MRWKESYRLSNWSEQSSVGGHVESSPGPPVVRPLSTETIFNNNSATNNNFQKERPQNGKLSSNGRSTSESSLQEIEKQNSRNNELHRRSKTSGQLSSAVNQNGGANNGELPIYSSLFGSDEVLPKYASLQQMQSESSINRDLFFQGKWRKRAEFLFTCLSLSLGIGNLWRFPYVAHDSGNPVVFVIIYVAVIIVFAFPLYYMESCLGQFNSSASGTVWRCLPVLKGLGFAQVISTIFLIIYFNFIIAQYLSYVILPWIAINDNNSTESTNSTTVGDFNLNRILQSSGKVFPNPNVDVLVLICLAFCWSLALIGAFLGVKFLKKAGYVTSALTYLVVIVLFLYAIVKRNDAVREKLNEGLEGFQAWYAYKALEQAFISLHIGLGHNIVRSSRNSFKHKIHRDIIPTIIADTLISVLVGMVVLCGVKESKRNDEGIFTNNSAIADISFAYSALFDMLESNDYLKKSLCSIFFFVLFITGLVSVVSNINSVIRTTGEEFPKMTKKKRWFPLSVCICLLSFSLGVILTTEVGKDNKLLAILDNYAVGATVFIYVILEVVGIMWIYGARQFNEDVKYMLDRGIGFFGRFIWAFLAPISLMVVFVYGHYEMVNQSLQGNPAVLPIDNVGTGWALAIIAVMQIFIWAFVSYKRALEWGFWEKLGCIFKPESDWGPADPMYRRDWLMKRSPKTPVLSKRNAHDNPAFNDN